MKSLRNYRWISAIVILVGIVGLAWVVKNEWPDSRARSAPAATPLRVVTSLGIFADMAANVGGESVEVTALIPAGTDPHAWEPSIREMRALAAADLFIYNGLGLEPWVERTLTAVAPPGLQIVILTKGLQPLGDAHFHVGGSSHGPTDRLSGGSPSRGSEQNSGSPGQSPGAGSDVAIGDPHMWLDVDRAIKYVRRMEVAFLEALPQAADDLRQQASSYVTKLEALDEWFRSQIEAISPERRILVTDHDAYVYMAERYGLTRAGFVTANPDREPSARELAQLADTIRQTGAPALFAEPHVGTSFIDELARETGVPVGVLYTDAFFGDIRTYIDLIRANGDALRTLLGESE